MAVSREAGPAQKRGNEKNKNLPEKKNGEEKGVESEKKRPSYMDRPPAPPRPDVAAKRADEIAKKEAEIKKVQDKIRAFGEKFDKKTTENVFSSYLATVPLDPEYKKTLSEDEAFTKSFQDEVGKRTPDVGALMQNLMNNHEDHLHTLGIALKQNGTPTFFSKFKLGNNPEAQNIYTKFLALKDLQEITIDHPVHIRATSGDVGTKSSAQDMLGYEDEFDPEIVSAKKASEAEYKRMRDTATPVDDADVRELGENEEEFEPPALPVDAHFSSEENNFFDGKTLQEAGYKNTETPQRADSEDIVRQIKELYGINVQEDGTVPLGLFGTNSRKYKKLYAKDETLQSFMKELANVHTAFNPSEKVKPRNSNRR